MTHKREGGAVSKIARTRVGLMVSAGLVLAAVTASLALSAGASRSALPGRNGRIVFDGGNVLYLVNPDGSGLVGVALTITDEPTVGAAFSADGRLIAYSRTTGDGGDVDIYTIRPDGSDQREV